MLPLEFLQSVGMAFPIMPVVQKWDFSYSLRKTVCPPSIQSQRREQNGSYPHGKMRFLQMKFPIPEVVKLVFH